MVSILAALSAPERKDLLVRVVDAVAGAPRPMCVAVAVGEPLEWETWVYRIKE